MGIFHPLVPLDLSLKPWTLLNILTSLNFCEATCHNMEDEELSRASVPG